jgi:hypothetical protein
MFAAPSAIDAAREFRSVLLSDDLARHARAAEFPNHPIDDTPLLRAVHIQSQRDACFQKFTAACLPVQRGPQDSTVTVSAQASVAELLPSR